jgi:hypothetical protein
MLLKIMGDGGDEYDDDDDDSEPDGPIDGFTGTVYWPIE